MPPSTGANGSRDLSRPSAIAREIVRENRRRTDEKLNNGRRRRRRTLRMSANGPAILQTKRDKSHRIERNSEFVKGTGLFEDVITIPHDFRDTATRLSANSRAKER